MAAIAAAPAAAAPAAAATPTAIFEPVDVFFVDEVLFCLEEEEAFVAACDFAGDFTAAFEPAADFAAGLDVDLETVFPATAVLAGAFVPDLAAGLEADFAEADFVAEAGVRLADFAAGFAAGFVVDLDPVGLRAPFEVVDPDLEGCFVDFAIGIPCSIGFGRATYNGR